MNVMVVAILLVNSVRKTISVINKANKTNKPNPKGIKFANHSANPVFVTAYARAMPPPKRNIKPHGNFFSKSSHSNIDTFPSLLRKKNSDKPPIMAITASSRPAKVGS